MLTIKDFHTGGIFPPPSEATRLNNYSKYRKVLACDSSTLMQENKKINPINTRYMGANNQLINVNYADILIRKTQDFILNEKIIFDLADSCECISREFLDELCCSCDITGVVRRAICDFVLYGDACVSFDQDGIYNVEPSLVYKIVDKFNIQKVKAYVVAFSFEEAGKSFLRVQEHHKGKYFERVYELSGGRIGKQIRYTGDGETIPATGKLIETGMDDFAILMVHNNGHTRDIYGHSDIEPLTSLISEIALRLSLNSRTLTKNSEKSLTGPRHALVSNPDGSHTFPQGSYIPLGEGEHIEEVGTSTDLADHFSQIELVEDRLFMLAELSPALVRHNLNAPSGIAIKRLLTNTLLRTSRISRVFEVFIRDMVYIALIFRGVDIRKSHIIIKIQDGIDTDTLEKFQEVNSRVEAGLLSKEEALVRLDGLTQEQAEGKINDLEGGEL